VVVDGRLDVVAGESVVLFGCAIQAACVWRGRGRAVKGRVRCGAPDAAVSVCVGGPRAQRQQRRSAATQTPPSLPTPPPTTHISTDTSCRLSR
jgi:hypothetical protein